MSERDRGPILHWRRQPDLVPGIVAVDSLGNITYEVGKNGYARRKHPGLSETHRLIAEYESNPENLARENKRQKQ